MQHRWLTTGLMLTACALLGAAGSAPLLAAERAPAPTAYTLQPLVTQGDLLGNTSLTAGADFSVMGLTDQGQLLFGTPLQNAKIADYDISVRATLLYDHGQFTPLVVPRGETPIGQWPDKPVVWGASLNQSGNVVFRVDDLDLFFRARSSWVGTFRWDNQARQLTPVVLPDMAAVNGLTFKKYMITAGWATNRSNEIAFGATVKDGSGKALGTGAFLLGRDGQLSPLALPGQALPNGRQIKNASVASLNDSGRIALVITASGAGASLYIWEQGTLTPVPAIGTDVPGGGKITEIWNAHLNNQNRNVLMTAGVSNSSYGAICLWSEGRLLSVAVKGQEMPGGGAFKGIRQDQFEGWEVGVSTANDAGQHAFTTEIREGGAIRTAAYLMEADGKLSLIFKSDTPTELGPISSVGWGGSSGVGLNNQGQVALPLKIDHGPSVLALLTPTLP